jgi:hypothetical protein
MLGKEILRCMSGDFVLYLYLILCSSSIGQVPDTLTVRSASQVWTFSAQEIEPDLYV